MNFDAIVAGLPLVLVVIGLVEWFKQLGVQGNTLRYVSMAIGLVIGIAYQISLGLPADFAGWFAACIYGLGLGLVASGIYDAATDIVKKVVE
jgi:hypothetical protein